MSGDQPLSILHDVSMRVMTSETIAIVGASGSGKSTLLSLMAGLDTPTSGKIRLGNEILGTLDEDGKAHLRAKMLGFVFQSFQLLPSLTAFENVLLPLELAAMPRAEAQQTAHNMLQRVALSERIMHYPKQLSGGEQQRVALARAFVHLPAMVFADEPTGNLDARTGAQVIDLMFEINQEQGTTLILVTHDEKIASRCTRIMQMNQGTLTELKEIGQ